MPRGRPKGLPKTGGRKPGGLNKRTVEIKAALVQAFDELGGVPALVKWGQRNRTEFYRIWSKLIPNEIKNADNEPFKVKTVTEVIVRTHQEAQALLPLINSRNGDA